MSAEHPVFRVTLAESPACDSLVAEVAVDDVQVAEIRRDGGTLRIAIWGRPAGPPAGWGTRGPSNPEWDLPYDAFVEAIMKAAAALARPGSP